MERGGPDVATNGKKWAGLTAEQQQAARTLGYNPASWDYEEPIALDDKKWSFLTPAEQEAALRAEW